MTHNIVDHHRLVQQLLDRGETFATITLVDIRGSAPQIVGAKAIVTLGGIEGGTVGGAKSKPPPSSTRSNCCASANKIPNW